MLWEPLNTSNKILLPLVFVVLVLFAYPDMTCQSSNPIEELLKEQDKSLTFPIK